MVLTEVDRYDPDGIDGVGACGVVLGGSLAGLCAARVLADAFDSVVVIERDEFPDEPVARDGAPQTGHPHALLEAGRATLEDLFPGFGDDLIGEGGLLIDAFSDIKWYAEGGFVADGSERSLMCAARRPLFERVVRRRVRSIEKVEFRDGCRFFDYCTEGGSAAVSGVAFRDAGGEERRLDADLVVDAMGRTSRTPEWLADNGFEKPPTDRVRIDVDYSTVHIERPPEDRRLFFVPPSAPRKRGTYIIPIEDDRWQVLLQGVHDVDTPAEPEGVVEFLDRLPVEEPAELVRAQPWVAESVHGYPFPSSLRRRYAELDRFPDGLVVTGDGVASFNPIYGQGMSVAALDALLLHHALAEDGLRNLPDRYFTAVSDVVDVVWQIAVGSDFGFEETTGPKPVGTDPTNRYLSRLIRRGHDDPELRTAVGSVLILDRPPSSLFRPAVVWRALRPTSG
jgi:2-polyprenyl-6-methoxyphenol hydroxylase-like FAD-dependent oxidoreductase